MKKNAVLKLCLFTLVSVLFFKTLHSQTRPTASKTKTKHNQQKPFDTSSVIFTRIRWTWQLPTPVQSSFNKSKYANWYIEKMIRFDLDDETFYRFYINNGNLLDGDHYDHFLKTGFLEISNDGTIRK